MGSYLPVLTEELKGDDFALQNGQASIRHMNLDMQECTIISLFASLDLQLFVLVYKS